MVDMDIKTDKTSDFIIKTFTSHFYLALLGREHNLPGRGVCKNPGLV
jgi:hypothetical protein